MTVSYARRVVIVADTEAERPTTNLPTGAIALSLDTGKSSIWDGSAWVTIVAQAHTHAQADVTNLVTDLAAKLDTGSSSQTKSGDLVSTTMVKAGVRLRVVAQGSNPADPPSGEADLIVIDQVTPVFRIRFNQAGSMKIADVALV